jgi:TOBE domain
VNISDANHVAGVASRRHAGGAGGARPHAGAVDGLVQVVQRPEELRLAPGAPGLANVGVPAVVALYEYFGHDTVYLAQPDGAATGAPLRARAGSVPQFTRGDRVVVSYQGPPAVAFAAATVDAEESGDAAATAEAASVPADSHE